MPGFVHTVPNITITRAALSATAASDCEIVAASTTGAITELLSFCLSFSGAVNVKWRSATTDKSGLFYGTTNNHIVAPHNPGGWLRTAANEALNLHCSATQTVGGMITYRQL